MSRADLHDVLAQAAKAAGISIQYNKRLTGIDQYPTGVKARFEDGSSDSGDILIGADGIRSHTRSIILPDGPQPAFVNVVGVGGFAKISSLPEITSRELRSLNFTFGAKGFFGYCAAGNQYAMWWSNLYATEPMSEQALRRLSLDSVKAEMLAIYKDFHAPISTLIEHTERRVDLFFYSLIAYYQTHAEPEIGRTYFQHGKGKLYNHKASFHACHSSLLPSFIDKSIEKADGMHNKNINIFAIK